MKICLTPEQFEASCLARAASFKAAAESVATRSDGKLCFASEDWHRLTVQHRKIGLGDAVAVVAQPIAKGIDAVLGTNVQGCGGCGQRQAALNRVVPDVLHPFR